MNPETKRRYSGLFFLAFAMVGLTIATHSPAQDLAPLTENEKSALGEITEKKVLATVSFLASDELQGRGTGSKEFDIAAAFVASRFRGAGLKGGAKNGSFYQVTEIEQWIAPAVGIELTGHKAPRCFGLLQAGLKPFASRSRVEFAGDKHSGPVIIAAEKSLADTLKVVRKLRRKGATAVLVQADENSDVAEIAKVFSQRPLARKPASSSIPVLVIEKSEFLKPGGEFEFEIKVPAARKVRRKVRNVIGVLKGSDEKLAEQAIVFSAHLDHLGSRQGAGDQIYNGADDNASGVTGVISLADAYAALKAPPKRTTVFIAFWGEERGLLGSKHFAETPLWPLEKTVANINLEMIGRPEDGARNKTWVTGWSESNLGALMAVGAKRTGTLVFEHPKFSGKMLYGASDNWPLVQKGVIAHSFSAGSLHSDYHQPSDQWQKLETDHMTAVIQGLFAGSLPIAQGKFTPKKK